MRISVASFYVLLILGAVIVVTVSVLVFFWRNGIGNDYSPPTRSKTNEQQYSDIQGVRDNISSLIREQRYSQATNFLLKLDIHPLVEKSVAIGDLRWMAVYEDTITFPGIDDSVAAGFNRSDYWVMPGTSDAILDLKWQLAATEFSKQYNVQLQELKSED